MSVLLYGAGAVAFLAGAVLLGFGFPVREFSFGNTLIVAGVVAMVGGMIVAALGMVVSHLQQLADALTRGAPLRAGRALPAVDAASRLPATPARIPFPPRPKAEQRPETGMREPSGFEPMPDTSLHEPAYNHAAPALPNPDDGPVTVDDEVSLSPRHPFAPAAQPRAEAQSDAEADEPLPPPFMRRDEAKTFDAPWRASPPPVPKAAQPQPAEPGPTEPKPAEPKPAELKALEPKVLEPKPVQPVVAPPPRQTAYFESMWPSEPKLGEPGFEPRKEAKADKPAEPKIQSPFAPPPRPQPKPEARPADLDDMPQHAFGATDEEPAPAEAPRNVAILKSGVVDGMGYTLYVDGSIEAELPQGTLRFASINELRGHLEKTA